MIDRDRANLYIFFFQAEDGIRDKLVTGVQTCALPIFDLATDRFRHSRPATGAHDQVSSRIGRRSEERRVGKECRSRWSPDHSKKNAAGSYCSLQPTWRSKFAVNSSCDCVLI